MLLISTRADLCCNKSTCNQYLNNSDFHVNPSEMKNYSLWLTPSTPLFLCSPTWLLLSRCKWVKVPVKAIWFTAPANMAVDSLLHLFEKQIEKIFSGLWLIQFALWFYILIDIMALSTSTRIRTSEIQSQSFMLLRSFSPRAMWHQLSSAVLWFPVVCCRLEYTSTNIFWGENNRHTRPNGIYNDVFPNMMYITSSVNTQSMWKWLCSLFTFRACSSRCSALFWKHHT